MYINRKSAPNRSLKTACIGQEESSSICLAGFKIIIGNQAWMNVKTNGLIGHKTKNICVPDRQSECWGDDLPLDIMVETARLKREKHVILTANVSLFAAHFKWKQSKLWKKSMSSRDHLFSLLVWLNFKWTQRQLNGTKSIKRLRLQIWETVMCRINPCYWAIANQS